METSENPSTENFSMMSSTTQSEMPFGNPLAPAEGYEYNFEGDLAASNPFDPLIGLPGIDDLGDIFGNLDPEDSPFAGGENPFSGGSGGSGGFGGGENPMPVEPDGGIGDGAGPIGGGDNPISGGSGGFGGFGGGGENPFSGGSEGSEGSGGFGGFGGGGENPFS
ncbi:MAG: hypothetical protein SWJ54_03595, partial [Cyanobacteriota bacterium]|nr:hypothetical protein [Cyanobacteriota bacterium]